MTLLRTAARLTALAVVVTLILPAATTIDAAAQSYVRKKHRAWQAPPRRVYDDNSVWYPNNADKLKFGSRIWWDQMQREGRLGGQGQDFRR